MTPQPTHSIESGINIEEGLLAIAKQILMLRCRYQEALAYKEKVVDEAVQRVESIRAEEKAVWEQHESYIFEALAHQEKLTGVPDFPCQFGTFTLQDTPPIVTVSDMDELQKWMGDFLANRMLLHSANFMLLHSAPSEDLTTKKAFSGMISPMLTDFYNRTGVLPDGCELSSSCRKPVLQSTYA